MSQANGRRKLLILGGVGLGWWAVSHWLRRPPPLDYADVEGLPGFRRAMTGPVSRGPSDPFIGITVEQAGPEPVPEIPPAQVCDTLFRTRGSAVPVASFSDYNCPYCRVLTQELQRREEAGRIDVTWHELPLLGDASLAAARVALAADMQGAYAQVHGRLMRTRIVAGQTYARRLAEGAGIDPDRLLRDMQSPEIDLRIARARGLARLFGFFGTPALVIGRTAVLGRVEPDLLDDLIAAEKAGPTVC